MLPAPEYPKVFEFPILSFSGHFVLCVKLDCVPLPCLAFYIELSSLIFSSRWHIMPDVYKPQEENVVSPSVFSSCRRSTLSHYLN